MKISKQGSIGVMGAGSMGIGIAQIAATAGHDVVLMDNNQEAMEKSLQKLQKVLNRLVEKERLTDQEAKAIFGRIHPTTEKNAFTDCDIIIEAIIEDLEIKKTVFASLEAITDGKAILATNTSSLPVTAIASACNDPSMVIGIHFFNPAPLMKLVEIIPAVQTRDEITNAARELIDSWGKVTVLVKDTPGFIVNRVARPFYSEALRIFDEGIANVETIDKAMTEVGGFRMGPFTLMDFIGHDINYKVTESMYNSYFQEPRYKPSFAQQRLVDAGYLGRKSGRGFYVYESGERRVGSEELMSEEREERGEDLGLLRMIFDRIICMLINEAADAVFWGVASKEEVDMAMMKGVNYPKGLLAWGEEIGYDKVVETLDSLYDFYREERYRVSPYLRNRTLRTKY